MITEEELIRRINIINKSQSIKRFIDDVKHFSEEKKIYKFESRIKSIDSALYSFRNNKNKPVVDKKIYRTVGMTNPSTLKSFTDVDSVVDLLAMRIVTYNANEIYKIRDFLIKKYSPFIIVDMINEPLLGFEYRAIHMYFKLKFDDLDFEVPLEIQLKNFDMHYAWFGLHDTIYKNNSINLEDGCTLLPILFKIFEFNVKALRRELNDKEKTDFSAIDCIINVNKKLFLKHESSIKYGCFLMAQAIYKDLYNGKLSEEELYLVFEKLSKKSIADAYSFHLYGDKGVDYATYCIATNNF